RAFHAAALLQDGKVLLVGGLASGGAPIASAELFDPVTMMFSSAGSMKSARMRAGTRVLPDGKVQVIGGDKDSTIEVFDPQAGFGPFARVLNRSTTLSDVLRAL